MKLLFATLILYAGVYQLEGAECKSEINPDDPKIYYLHVKSDIKYRYATTTVTSKVVNPANHSQEVFFLMNLPETAFITSFIMEINGKEYEAYVKEKEEAKQIYDEAVASGLSAGHVAVNSRDSNNFKISVNVESMDKVKFILTYEELLQRTLGLYKHVINLNPGQTVRDLKIEVNISESSQIKSLFVPEIKVTNEIDTNEKENKLVETKQPNKKEAIIKYTPSIEDQEKAGGKCFEGQFIVQYDVDREDSCGQILVDDGYFVHFFAPEGLPPLNKLVIFVLDLSGSMYGRKLVQLKEAMTTILDELSENNYFSIVEFSYSVTVHNLDSPSGSAVISPDSWYREPNVETKLPSSLEVQQAYPANKDYVEKAKQVIEKMSAGGGTNIYDALKTAIRVSQKALEKIKAEKNNEVIEPLIVFLTDGEPTVGISNLKSIQSMVLELNIPRTSLFSLGFGDGADINFLKKLSLGNAGFARTIYEASDAALQLKNFYKQISSPLLSNVTFTYLSGQVSSLTKKNFHSLFHGSELVVAGKLVGNNLNNDLHSDVSSISQNGTSKCVIQGNQEIEKVKSNDGETLPTVPIDEAKKSDVGIILPPKPKDDVKKGFGSLERLWAYLTIKELLDQKEAIVLDSESEKAEELKKNALNLALKYKFVTPLTSLVVVKPNQSESLSELKDNKETTIPIYANAVPASASGFGMMIAPMPFAPSLGGGQYYSIPLSSRSGYGGQYHRPASISSGTGYGVFAGGLPGAAAPPQHMFATTTVPTVLQQTVDRMDAENAEEYEPPYMSGNLTLSDIKWFPQLVKADTNGNNVITITHPDGNQTLYVEDKPYEDIAYGNCTTRTKSKEFGRCVHLKRCILPEFTSDFDDFINYLCPISATWLGVCCPVTRINEANKATTN